MLDDWVKKEKERLGKKIDAYVDKHNKSTIEIPAYDFFVMLNALRDVCDEWGASSEVKEITYPVYKKYMDINE